MYNEASFDRMNQGFSWRHVTSDAGRQTEILEATVEGKRVGRAWSIGGMACDCRAARRLGLRWRIDGSGVECLTVTPLCFRGSNGLERSIS